MGNPFKLPLPGGSGDIFPPHRWMAVLYTTFITWQAIPLRGGGVSNTASLLDVRAVIPMMEWGPVDWPAGFKPLFAKEDYGGLCRNAALAWR